MPTTDNREFQIPNIFPEYEDMTETELLTKVKNHERDGLYMIRDTLGKKGTIKKTVPVLVDILRGLNKKEDFLDRYHITECLFTVMHIDNDDIKRKIIGLENQFDPTAKDESLARIKEILIDSIIDR